MSARCTPLNMEPKVMEVDGSDDFPFQRGDFQVPAVNFQLGWFNHELLLMEEILHHLGVINPVNNGINYLSTGAGFWPSTSKL